MRRAAPSPAGEAPADPATDLADAPSLRLLHEARIADLLGPAAGGLNRLEASGVLVEQGSLWVIFDNVPFVARLDPALTPDDPDAVLVRHSQGTVGYEDIAHDRATGRFYLLIEAQRRAPGVPMARVHEFDRDFARVGRRWLDAPLERENKGIEGLTFCRRDGRGHLLGLCEGNRGRAGRAGRRPGGGRVHVFAEGERTSECWQREATIHLPAALPFIDYSGIALSGDRLAVVSQESSALWVGRLHPERWEVLDDGDTFVFPRDRRGRTTYGNVEGVCWLSEAAVVVVSDRAKRDQPARMRAKDQSVHVFELPGAL